MRVDDHYKLLRTRVAVRIRANWVKFVTGRPI